MFTAKKLLNLFNNKQTAQLVVGATGLSLANYYYNQYNTQNVSCCGIIGVISKKKNVEDILVDGVQLLQNRGYDSAGLSTISEGQKEFVTTKLASTEQPKKIDCIDYLTENAKNLHKNCIAGIAHTRWATCGEKVDKNSHPHLDFSNQISIVHNGTLKNYEALKEELLKNEEYKIELRSDTDSELISQITSIYMKKHNLTLKEAIEKIIQDEKIQGQWGIVGLDKDKPHEMVVARRGSPIMVGLDEDTIYVASEKIGFQSYISKCMEVQENEIILLSLEQEDHKAYRSRTKTIPNIKIQKKPKPGFDSFFHQEIYEQQESFLDTIGKGSRLRGKPDSCKLGGLEQHEEQIKDIDNLLIVACGSSFQASCYAASFLKKLQCLNSIQCIEGSEFCEYDLPMGKSAIVIVSQSGETADLRKALEVAQKNGLFSIGVINAVGSQIATMVDCGIYLNCGREVAVAATKSFTSQIAALIMLSIWISSKKDTEKKKYSVRKELVQALQILPVTINSTLADIDKKSKEVAQKLFNQSTIICLGKGPCAAIAKEGALKLKELTYIHAEAFSAGELKHGPLALINPNIPKSTTIIIIILDDEYIHEMNICLSEVHSRGAQTVILTDCAHKINAEKTDYLFHIQHSGVLTSLLCVLAFQKITLEICRELGVNPDKPRNLAKTVTTD